MKVSVVISSYNGENYIEECIKSILEQTFTDFEIIIVDDQSSDKISQILQIKQSFDNKFL